MTVRFVIFRWLAPSLRNLIAYVVGCALLAVIGSIIGGCSLRRDPGQGEQVSRQAARATLYVIGGRYPEMEHGSASAVEALDPASRKWREITPLTMPRERPCAVAWKETLYVFGGQSVSPGTVDFVREVERYDSRTGRWTVVSRLPPELAGLAACARIGDSVYLIGWVRMAAAFNSSQMSDVSRRQGMWVYGLRDGYWRRAPDLPERRVGFAAVAWDRKVYVFGGREVDGSSPVSEVLTYEVNRGRWVVSASKMPTSRVGLAAVEFEGRIWTFGGIGKSNSAEEPSRTVEVFDPGTGRWVSGPKLPQPRAGDAAAVLRRRVYLIGASGTGGRVLTLEPATGRWKVASRLSRPREDVAAVALLSDGPE